MINWSSRLSNKNTLIGKDVYILPSHITFKNMDGYIHFAILTINVFLETDINKEAKGYMRKIRGMLSKLLLVNTLYDEKKETYVIYCEHMSRLMGTKINKEVIEKNKGVFKKFDDIEDEYLVVIRGSDYNKDYFDRENEEKDFLLYVADSLLSSLNSFKIDNERLQGNNWYLSEQGCHIEIIFSINMLLQSLTYLLNCRGSKEKELFWSDKHEINRKLDLVNNTMKHIKHLH